MKSIALLLVLTGTMAIAQNQAWVARYHERGYWSNLPNTSPDSISEEFATAMTVDDSGNVYVAGWNYLSAPPINNSENKFVTLKYDPLGRLCWASFYDNPSWRANGTTLVLAQPTSIAVDGAHNVYVTGSAPNALGTDLDFATIKYDLNGNQLWIATYDGPGHGIDRAAKVAVDQSGNVYVAGSSAGSGTGFDYATIKYDANGNQEWASRYDGSRHTDDYGLSVAPDGSGNVFVTGTSANAGGFVDIVSAKYDANGNELWNRTFDGSGNAPSNPTSIAVDASGNLYVTGGTYLMRADTVYVVDSTNGRIVARVQPGPLGAYMVTLKYNGNGDQVWMKTFNGSRDPQQYGATSYAMELDGSGRINLLEGDGGSGHAIVQYDAGGNQLSAKSVSNYDGSLAFLAADGNGNVYVAGQGASNTHGGGFSGQYATLMFDARGNQIWDARYDNPAIWDAQGSLLDAEYPNAMAVDGRGNVYVTGTSFVPHTGYDIATVKYAAAPISSQQIASVQGSLKAIFFFDQTTGWAVGARGIIMKTTDGGSSWSTQQAAGSSRDLMAISMIDASNGFTVGKKGTILKTTDGGSTWISQQNGSQSWTRKDLLQLTFADANSGIATGKSGAILKTLDGGSTWSVTPARGISSMNDICFADLLNGWAVGKRGAILKSTDGGNTWTPVKSYGQNVTTSALTRVSFSDRLHGWAAGANIVLSTADGGNAWTRYGLSGRRSFTSLHVGKNGSGAAVASNGSVVYLQPAGIISMSVATSTHSLNDICFVNSSDAFAAGADGSILRLSAGAPSVTIPITDFRGDLPVAFEVKQNYPNPFNPTTTIEYTLPEYSRVTLKVFNLLGQEVKTLLDEEVDAGDNTAEWNARGVASGIYFYRLDARSIDHPERAFSAWKKMALIK